mmetsp:Transcript_2799/g.5660  ORF Transcript_2799/g.5660 Transcript_2799/m.5660 type:complete len:215 (-) Transcript_2799:119-763(-)|eukprot:CAMPEP_0172460308 /NCGR_PEP_ID=MMETSP1065-20121228/36387_1 /TAXON_ID=265537 /ORGANISM="Amphiprora paludosa, Strain CCMP125" /LENGTH=214 /DNA_ID=CAMNT_0013215299 /DNA_START=23 /DNA_END=667 /DNA_ORIENTATION=+
MIFTSLSNDNNTMIAMVDHDDCCSVSSTVTANQALHDAAPKKSHRTKKTVSFDDAGMQVHTYSSPEHDAQDLYFTAHDYQAFRTSSQATAKVAQMPSSMNSHYREMVQRLYQACSSYTASTSTPVQQELSALLSTDEMSPCTLLGLERMSISEIRRGKSWRQEEMMDVIREIQEDILFGQDPEEVAERIALECQRISRVSCQFAQQLASATMSH